MSEPAILGELSSGLRRARDEYRRPALEFDRRFARWIRQRRQLAQALMSNDVDRYVTAQAPAVFLAAPQVLYAVNRHVRFFPSATSFELAETRVGRRHWSKR